MLGLLLVEFDLSNSENLPQLCHPGLELGVGHLEVCLLLVDISQFLLLFPNSPILPV